MTSPQYPDTRRAADAPPGLAPPRIVRAGAAATAVLLAVYLAHAAVDLGSDRLFRDVPLAVAYLLPALICWLRVHRVPENRTLWAIFASAMTLWFVGDVITSVYVVKQSPPPYPSLADAFFLGFYPLAYVAVALLLRVRAKRLHANLWLDGLLGALALAAAAGAYLLEPLLHLGTGSTPAALTSLAYPLADVLLLAIVGAVLVLTGGRPSRAVGIVIAGLVITVATDTLFLFDAIDGGTYLGRWYAAGWPIGLLAFGLAAWAPATPPELRRVYGRAALIGPAVLALLALSVLVVAGFAGGVNRVAVTLATAAAVVAVIRLAVTLHDSHRLDRLARHDPLTGLPNQSEFHRCLGEALERAQREGAPFSVLLLDLDGFKRLNDLRGHAEGDAVLRRVAAILRDLSRAGETPGRLGGDEFGMVLPGATAAEASTVGRRIEGAVDGLAEGLGVSHGAAEWPQDGPTKEMVLLRADVALYAAKRRNGDGTGAPASPAGPATEGTPAPITDLERAQLDSYARDVRDSYVRELRRTNELHESYLATVKTLAAAVEAKDEYTGGHIQRVLALGLLLARAVAPEDADDPQLTYGFLLHDIGKLAVPDAVLTKPGKLTDEEWALMREHPEAGARILANVPFLERALEVVLHHHERWDGGGYPHGLAGDDIPQWARIFAIVDTVDAITSDRPYRAGRPLAVAVEQVLDGAGTQFDPDCARAFAGLDSDSVEALLQHRPDTDLRPRRAPERTAAGTPAELR